MASSHSNRSPSQISSRPINPNSRTPEIPSPATRRSFNGTKPFALTNPKKSDSMTPANSPSDYARRRRSVGDAGSCLRNFEEKENDVITKDQMPRASKLQSPAKGFMAPTISAASKFTPSPRKRPLVERNEAVRTSISLSDGKAMFFSNISEDSEPPKPVLASKPSKKVTFLDYPQDSSDPNSSKIEPDSQGVISRSPLLPSIAPLDADPSMPPYDPKTNFLSPRPQFLYYKPNPRIEVLLSKENETGPDESDSFSSDSEVSQDSEKDKSKDHASGDTVTRFEAGDLCVYDEDSEKDKSEDIASDDKVTRFEADDLCVYDEVPEKEKSKDVASADIIEGLDFSEDDITVSSDFDEDKMEPIASADEVLATGMEEISENLNYVRKAEKKSWSVSRLMCFSTVVMLLLMAACVSVSVTRAPSLEEFGLIKDLSFFELGKFYHRSRVVATDNAKVVWETCSSFVSKVVNEIGQGDKMLLGPLKYANLSDLEKGIWNNAVEDDGDDDDELDYEMGYFEEEYVNDDDIGEEEEYADGDYECDEGFEDKVSEQEDEVSEIEDIVPGDSSDTQSPREILPSSFSAPPEEVLEIDEIVLSELSELDSEYREDTQSPTEIVPSSVISAPQDQESETVLENEAVPSGSDATLMDQESMSDAESSTEKSSKNSAMPLAYYVVGISSFVIAALSAVAVFRFQYKRIPSFQEEKMEVGDNSLCPSEMSSFEPYSNSKKEARGENEVQSLEAKTGKHYSKRESLASSSSEFTMGSPSYGSFTTFERIPIKNANGEEEIITPVRRSSRIRTQHFTSS